MQYELRTKSMTICSIIQSFRKQQTGDKVFLLKLKMRCYIFSFDNIHIGANLGFKSIKLNTKFPFFGCKASGKK